MFVFRSVVPKPLVRFLRQLAHIEGSAEEYYHHTELALAGGDEDARDDDHLLAHCHQEPVVVVAVDTGTLQREAWSTGPMGCVILSRGWLAMPFRERAWRLLHYWPNVTPLVDARGSEVRVTLGTRGVVRPL